jgi:toxin-antitoxin system PIN domain toxin
VILIDANILLYAYNASSEFHKQARKWLEDALSGVEPVRFSLLTVVAFVRISTNIHAFPKPFRPSEAVGFVHQWLSRPNVDLLLPGERYWEIFARLVLQFQVRGPLVTDAHLAALALEHGASICSHDEDFSRFHGVSIVDPCRE